MKLKIKALLAIAAALGYTGTDPAAAKAHIEANAKTIQGPDGKTIETKDLEWEAEVDKKAVSITADMVAQPSASPTPIADPADLDKKAAAMAEAILKQMGHLTKPPHVPDTKAVVTVKSPGERIYDLRVKCGHNKFENFDKAAGMALWLRAKMYAARNDFVAFQDADRKFKEWHDIHGKAYATTSPTAGAALVPDVFVPDLIKNVLEYGVARRIGKMLTMGSDKVLVPRRTGGLSGSYPLENTAPTASNATYDNVELNAHTFQVLALASNEILQDSGIPLVDEIMNEMALAIATQEDNAFFIGDGSSTYAGMTGFEFKYGLTATDGGYVYVGGADSTAHTHQDVVLAMARVPQYARRNMIITCSPTLKSAIFDRLATSTNTGGLTLDEVTGFGLVSKYLGIPIIENNSMSSVTVASTTNRPGGFTAGDQIDALIGDFSRAALFGTRLDMEMAVDTSAAFTSYGTYFRGVVRHDVNVHSVGTSTAAGPVVSFWQT